MPKEKRSGRGAWGDPWSKRASTSVESRRQSTRKRNSSGTHRSRSSDSFGVL